MMYFLPLLIDLTRFKALDETLDIFNYIFTSIFLIEAILRMVALGFVRYIKEK